MLSIRFDTFLLVPGPFEITYSFAMDKYTSLVAWQASHKVALTVLRLTDLPRHPRTRPIFDQLRRAAISIEANVVEGYALNTTPQFRRHLRIARGSAAECECLIRIATELSYLTEPEAQQITVHLDKSISTITGLIRSLKE